MRFKGMTAIATGAASGMGLLFCQCFANEGGNVLLCDINEEALIEKTKQSITLLKERRAAFITAAVTGQIDLRGEH